MQFSIVALVAAFAATTTASYLPTNGTTTAYYPTATGTGSPSKPTTSQIPFTGAAAVPTQMAGSALGLVVVGGVALLF
ncbi:Nn.00g099730.m01.CDS01 [Neocucurbitaria sp. VM-36]